MTNFDTVGAQREVAERLPRLAASCSLLAGGILLVMCALTLITGKSQQTFELYATPSDYGARLLASASVLRTILFFDDLFIAAYATATILFLRWLSLREPAPLLPFALAAAVLAGCLDLLENHHILTMLHAAERDVLPTSSELRVQMLASSSKWMLGHVAFAMIGVTLVARGAAMRAFRFALIAVQLPIGVLAWTQTNAQVALFVEWARYGNLLIGFVLLARLMTHARPVSRAGVAADSGVPA